MNTKRKLFAQAVPAAVAGAAAMSLAVLWGSSCLAADTGLFDRGEPRIYKDQYLNAVNMPMGGIGSGSIWISGKGTLSVWQMFNNSSEIRIPNSFLAVKTADKTGKPVLKALQTEPMEAFGKADSLEFAGDYPFARIAYKTPDLPVEIGLEAFNPMIPCDTKNSSLPCAIFRLKAKNTSATPVDLSFIFACQNPVGYDGHSGYAGNSFPNFGGNVNEFKRTRFANLIHLKTQEGTIAALGKGIKLATSGVNGRELDGTCSNLTVIPFNQRATTSQPFSEIDAIWWHSPSLNSGGADEAALIYGLAAGQATNVAGIFLAGISPEFIQKALSAGDEEREAFEDFESGTYTNWTVEGDAFGKAPVTGTIASQQPVFGFKGRHLVNSYSSGDVPRGKLTSKPFAIKKDYISFLIGGGNNPGQECINLVVDGKVVRTATGRDMETLLAAHWNVKEFKGKQGAIEIVDNFSRGWGHINIDDIVFANVEVGAAIDFAKKLNLRAAKATTVKLPAPEEMILADTADSVRFTIGEYTKVEGLKLPDGGKVLASAKDGSPVIVQLPFGTAKMLLVLAPIPRAVEMKVFAAMLGTTFTARKGGLPKNSPFYGEMTLGALGSSAKHMLAWETLPEMAEKALKGEFAGKEASSPASPMEKTLNCALSVPLSLKAGEEKTATFFITWYFPNRYDPGAAGPYKLRVGNKYNNWFKSSADVAEYLGRNFDYLYDTTRLYNKTLYESSLPYWFLDALSAPCCIMKSQTMFWTEDDFVGAWEGCYACCGGNCTHVWNYAQAHARLFPDIGRNLRKSEFLFSIQTNGLVPHRITYPLTSPQSPAPAIDGQCAVIEGAYREYLMSADRTFLDQVWPGVQKAMGWLIATIDPDEDGVPAGHQHNTYDTAVSGATTFIGTQYLSALRACARMAEAEGDGAAKAQFLKIADSGYKKLNDLLWNGEYYTQIPQAPPAYDYNTGCHSDQLLGQWWSHQLNLGYLLPKENVGSALKAIFKYNYRTNFTGFVQTPRVFVRDDQAGLIICTWPKGGRPSPFILYADEIWTGLEYELAAAMIYEGLLDEGFTVAKAVRDRYNGRWYNPFAEIECGSFYARALSNWSLLLACQGYIYNGPEGIIGFKPRFRPENHASFFTAAEGWGLFKQARGPNSQEERIELRYGKLTVKSMVFQAPDTAKEIRANVMLGSKKIKAEALLNNGEVVVKLPQAVDLSAGQSLLATLQWP